MGRIVLLLCLVAASDVWAEKDVESTTTNDRRKQEERASRLYEALPGFDSFKADFAFDKPPFIGLVNGFPESIYAWIRTKQPRLVDALWWWDPIDNSGKPKVDWNQFRAAYEDASRHISRHSWLEGWKRAQRDRKIELHLFGTEVGEPEFLMESDYEPAWKIAGFKGHPDFSVLLRRPDDSWILVLFGREDPRALMLQSFVRPHDGRTPHWLDKFDLSFHPKGRRGEADKYLIISPTGEHELGTNPNAMPARLKKVFTPYYSGGDGSSVENAIGINASDEKTGIAMEYAYLKKKFPDFVLKSQSLFLQTGGKTYDVLEIRTAGKKRVLYFDISSYSGKS